jgi:hypothetical protein
VLDAVRSVSLLWEARRRVEGDAVEDYTAITTFSPRGYALYGRRFVESFLRYWSIPLIAYFETERPDLTHPRLNLRDLDLDAERAEFMRRYDRPEFRGTPNDYATQAIRFSHKVFALTSSLPWTRWCLWIDADVETFAPVTPEILRTICPEESALSYLGRRDADHSETGFVAYRLEDSDVVAMLADLRRMYTSGALFELDARQRNDSAMFDRARARIPADGQHNLSRDVEGTHVWPHTVLGRVMRHRKGQARKREAYGDTVA